MEILIGKYIYKFLLQFEFGTFVKILMLSFSNYNNATQSEFDKYMKSRHYRREEYSTDTFTSPVRVMIYLVLVLGVCDYFFVKYK